MARLTYSKTSKMINPKFTDASKAIKLIDIRLDGETQQRVEINNAIFMEYV